MKNAAAVLVLICCCLLSAQITPVTNVALDLPVTAKQAMHSIDPEKIRASVKLLPDDSYEGSGTGQKAGEMAGEWIAAQFKSYGLAPAGDNGTYFQNINFFGVTADAKQTRFAFVPKSSAEIALKFADDYVANDLSH